MTTRSFSLLVLPDDSTDMKGGHINTRLLLWVLGGLSGMFILCVLIIAGYHIKVWQEESYMETMHTRRELVARIGAASQDIEHLSHVLASINSADRVMRLVESMDVVDDEMYQAGVGGHVIVDATRYGGLSEQVQQQLVDLEYSLVTLASRTKVQQASLEEINAKVQDNIDIINHTPSILPTFSIRITSGFGYRTHPITGKRDYHKGIDLAGRRGQRIFAAADGVVTYAKYHYKLGNCVKIRHKYGYETIYGHLLTMNVAVGQRVSKRDLIGTMGSTGSSTGTHLHYGVMLNKRAENPTAYFSL